MSDLIKELTPEIVSTGDMVIFGGCLYPLRLNLQILPSLVTKVTPEYFEYKRDQGEGKYFFGERTDFVMLAKKTEQGLQLYASPNLLYKI